MEDGLSKTLVFAVCFEIVRVSFAGESVNDAGKANGNHRHTKPLPHVKGHGILESLLVFLEMLHENAESEDAHHKDAEQGAMPDYEMFFPIEEPQEPEDGKIEECLVNLSRMPGDERLIGMEP